MSRNIRYICIYIYIYHKCGLRFINILVPLIISVTSLDFLCSFYALPEGTYQQLVFQHPDVTSIHQQVSYFKVRLSRVVKHHQIQPNQKKTTKKTLYFWGNIEKTSWHFLKMWPLFLDDENVNRTQRLSDRQLL